MLDYFTTMLSDTAKLRELQSDGTFTDLCAFVPKGRNPFDAQDHLIKEAYIAAERARATGLTSPQFVDAAVSGTPGNRAHAFFHHGRYGRRRQGRFRNR